MNMRKNMRNKIGNGGFSLVELIVVIAIMAVLAAVAVIGVSVYVDKASEAADRQTIMDVEKALIMGGYSGGYAPDTVVGVVTISKDAKAQFGGNPDINQMMIDAFGPNWVDEVKFQSDVFVGSDRSKVLEAVKKAQESNNNYFASVPESSYFGEGDNTDQLTADVDQLAAALGTVLSGMKNGNSSVSKLWGENFNESFGGTGIDYSSSSQMAANLTVFAAANAISGASDADKQALVNGWVKGQTKPTEETAMVMNLSMQFAQCTAIKNYVFANSEPGERDYDEVDTAYNDLMKAMENLKNSTAYVNDFNTAISEFMDTTSGYQQEWRATGQAKTDAEAFIASMSAVNALEDTYVNANQADKLGEANFYTNNGAADILGSMVQYSQMENLPDGDYVITLIINKEGVPTIVPPLSRD
jgi:prepilin-type N-terminal cleavage/methylation domain-containing protein